MKTLQIPFPPPPPPWQEAKKTQMSVVKVFQIKNELFSYLILADNCKKNITLDPEPCQKIMKRAKLYLF